MPIGIITNALVIIVGGFLGSVFGKRIPDRLRTHLPMIFGIASIAIGVSLVVKLHSLPAITLSLILGTTIGELLDLESKVEALSTKLKLFIEKITGKNPPGDEMYIQKFVTLLVLFCTGTSGILGSMTEGMTGDHSILFSKAIMDLFTSAIFAASLGYLVMIISIPQFITFMLLFFLSNLILPLTNPEMLQDFIACGGVIGMAAGFRICEIKLFRIINILPALLLALPISWLWSFLFV